MLIKVAISFQIHVKYFPILMHSLGVNAEDELVKFGLLLHEITERITSPSIREYEILILEVSQ